MSTILDDPEYAFHALASTLEDDRIKELNGVVFDSEGNRHELNKHRVGSHENMAMLRFRLGNEPDTSIEFFGIEGLTVEGERYHSRLAVQRAAKQGIGVLPLPIVESKLEFNLSTIDGQTINSSTWMGRVVIIDCWASWCDPCIRQFPKLKELYEQHHADGLEIIGVSIDENPKAAEKIYQAMAIPWSLVTIPPNEKARKFWEDAARIQTVPRVLVIDRWGVLKSDNSELPVDRVLSLLRENAKD